MTLRFVSPQKAPFEFTVVAFHSVEPMAKTASLPFPRFPTAEESETKLSAQVPEGLELSATAFRWQNDQNSPTGASVPTLGRNPPAMLVGGDYDRGLGKVEVAWQPYRPELNCEVRAEVSVQDRQIAIQQSFKFQLPEGDVRPIRFRGPMDASARIGRNRSLGIHSQRERGEERNHPQCSVCPATGALRGFDFGSVSLARSGDAVGIDGPGLGRGAPGGKDRWPLAGLTARVEPGTR